MIREQSFKKKTGSNTAAGIVTQPHQQGAVGKQANKSTENNKKNIKNKHIPVWSLNVNVKKCLRGALDRFKEMNMDPLKAVA